MFVVKPVQDKNIQEELCKVCGCTYLPADFAYFAANLNDDGSKLLGILGICQFSIIEDRGLLHNLTPFPQTFDEEVMTIMVRTVMEFIHRCQGKALVLAPDAMEADFARRIGFTPGTDGLMQINLVEFFQSPCHFQAKIQKNTDN